MSPQSDLHASSLHTLSLFSTTQIAESSQLLRDPRTSQDLGEYSRSLRLSPQGLLERLDADRMTRSSTGDDRGRVVEIQGNACGLPRTV
jgi:hypothetical protein